MDALRHTYTEQKRKLDAMKILLDKAVEINSLFMEEDMRTGKYPGGCEHRRALCAALTQVETSILNFQDHLSPLVLIEDTPPAFALGHLMRPDAEESRGKLSLPSPEMMEFLPDDDTAQAIVTMPAPAPEPAPVILPGTPNPEIDEDDLPF